MKISFLVYSAFFVRLLPVGNSHLSSDNLQSIKDSELDGKNRNSSDEVEILGYDNTSLNLTLEKSATDEIRILPEKCGTQRHISKGRIVGGTEAALGEFPWMVRIIHKNSVGYKTYGCSGFLIHSKYVLTAAHCVESDLINIRGPLFSVAIGEHNIETKIDCTLAGTCADPVQYSRINKIIVHPEYSKIAKNHHNDIALIYLNKGARFSDYVQPICLLENAKQQVTKYYITGWGKTETRESSPVKLKVSLNPYDKEECKQKFSALNLNIDNTQICAGGDKMKDSCNGDSGGPLMIYSNRTYSAAGLVSYGIGCGYQGWPGIYTSIPSYFTWIKNQILATSMSTRDSKVKKGRKNKRIKTSKKVKTSVTIKPHK